MSIGVIASGAAAAPGGGASYSSVVLSDAPLVYYRLGEASGASAVDSSGNARTATYQGGPTLGVAGKVAGNTAVTFDGVDDRVVGSSTAGLDTNEVAMTAEAWVKGTATGNTAERGLVGRMGGSDTLQRWWLLLDDGKPRIYVHGLTMGYPTAVGPTSVLDGAWHHIVGVRGSGTLAVWVDGVQVATGTWPLNGLSGGDVLSIGATTSGAGTAWFTGQLDEVALYGTVLSQARIQAHYNAANT